MSPACLATTVPFPHWCRTVQWMPLLLLRLCRQQVCSLEIWSIYSSAYYPHTALQITSLWWVKGKVVHKSKGNIPAKGFGCKINSLLACLTTKAKTALTMPCESCCCSKWVERRKARQGVLPTSEELNISLQDKCRGLCNSEIFSWFLTLLEVLAESIIGNHTSVAN